MINWNYKGPLVFYNLSDISPIDAIKRTKKNPLGKAPGKRGGNITQEGYVQLILPYIEARLKELERQGRHMVF